MAKIIPIGDKVLVQPKLKKEKSSAGIILPDSVEKEKPEQGKVVEVGSGRFENGKKIPMTVKKGDRVVFSKYGYDEIKIDGQEYYIIEESKILAIIK